MTSVAAACEHGAECHDGTEPSMARTAVSSRTPGAASSVLASGQAEGQADRDDRDARPH
jgi:hypothetical protein